MHIGLIGGIGVAATVVYYQRLTAKVGKKFDLTIVHSDVHELIANNLANPQRKQEQAAIFAGLVERLRNAGCDCAALTSLGAHFCFPELLQRATLPIISAIEPLDSFFVENNFHKVGLLGTGALMRSRMFGQLEQTEAAVPSGDLDELGLRYQNIATKGVCSDENRQIFFDAGREMITQQGADVVVLAGTDLNLAFDGRDPGFPYVDALDVHVDLLADLAIGKREI